MNERFEISPRLRNTSLALIAVGITVGATALGTALDGLFNQVATQLNAV